MIRLVSAASALVLFALPFSAATTDLVALPGLVGLMLAAAGITTLSRWLLTAAACVFVTDYALALWTKPASISVVNAAGFGLALVILLQSLEVARCAHGAAVDAAVVRSQLAGWIGLAAATLATTMVLLGFSRGLAGVIPFAAAPLVAAAGAVGVVFALAKTLMRRAP